MTGDRTYETLSHVPAEIEHRYGPRVHLLSNPLALTLLAKLAAKGTVQPEVNRLLEALYRMLTAEAVAAEFPRRHVEIPTRMIERTELGVWRGEAVDRETPTAVVAIARGGILPAQIVFDFLHLVLEPIRVRQDHLALGRTVDGSGKVTGADLGSAKIGGSVDGAMVLVPDPMGATGSTLVRVLDHYAENHGRPVRTVALNLIVTPEYLRRLRDAHPETVIYAFRLDRGLSAPEVLASVPGERWEEERGLDGHDYIVPGAGGLGEVITNSWV
jgi:uracil phosphoribosyltransferase